MLTWDIGLNPYVCVLRLLVILAVVVAMIVMAVVLLLISYPNFARISDSLLIFTQIRYEIPAKRVQNDQNGWLCHQSSIEICKIARLGWKMAHGSAKIVSVEGK